MCRGNLKSETATIIFNMLRGNKAIQRINLEGNVIGDECSSSMSSFLSENETLVALEFGYNQITSIGASKIFESLYNHPQILSLNFTGNSLDDKCMKELAELMSFNTTIETLSIGIRITDEGLEILAGGLIGNLSLKTLDLTNNEGITEASLPIIVDIGKKSAIKTMNVVGTSIQWGKQSVVQEALKIPLDRREIPIASKSKSAAKR